MWFKLRRPCKSEWDDRTAEIIEGSKSDGAESAPLMTGFRSRARKASRSQMPERPVAAGTANGPALVGVPIGYWSRRWILVCGCFLSILVCYIDRVNISYAILPMATEYGWDTATQGWVLSSFFMGYLVTQLLGGWWAAHIGGRALLAFGVLGGRCSRLLRRRRRRSRSAP